MKTIRNTKFEIVSHVDYTAQCTCGYEQFFSTLKEAKKESREHVNTYSDKSHEIYIDRNKDLEIDDTFKSVIVKRR